MDSSECNATFPAFGVSLEKKLVSFVTETRPAIYCLTHSSKVGKQGYLKSLLRIILVILPDIRCDTKVEMEMEIPSSSNVKLITECSDTTYTCYEVIKDLIKVSKLPQTLISYSSSQVHKMAIDY
ncbi:hypothetical protein Tco_1362211 [Tanacetum coccineum]